MNWLLISALLGAIIVICLYLGLLKTNDVMIGGATTVTLFSKCNYTGTKVPISLGFHKITEFGAMAPIMSIKIPKGLAMTIMKNGGGTMTLTENVPCVYLTRFMIVSINITKTK